ncbi:MAG: nitroreductase family protein [Anaerolineae bacterium]
MELYEVIRTRRSIRKYRPDPIPQAVLERILDAARIAPWGTASRVGQPVRLIVVRDAETRAKLVPLCHKQAFIATAPVVIVACGYDIGWNRGGWMGRYAVIVDVAIAVDHLTLAARAEGLGTCWIGSFDNAALKELFELPDDINVVALTPLGYPDGDLFTGPEGRISLDEFVHWNGWR